MAIDDQGGAPAASGFEHRYAPDGSRRVQDRRVHRKVWIPTYVLRAYGCRLGPNGLSLYMALAWHCTSEAPTRWPSYGQLADLVGCSRSTVERTIRVLRELLLIETSPCVEPSGQKSNWIYLIDPPEEREQPGSHGTESASAVLPTAPPCPTDGAPTSHRQGGAVTETAPSLDPNYGSERGGTGEAGAPTPRAAPSEEESAIARLSAQWLAQLAVAGSGPERAHREEIGPTVAELLRLGWTEDQLRASLDDPERMRFEWPRQWRERLGRPKRAAKRPARPLQTPPSPAGAIPDPPNMAEVLRELTGGLGLAGEFKRRAAEAARLPANGLTDRAGQSAPAPPANHPPAAPGE